MVTYNSKIFATDNSGANICTVIGLNASTGRLYKNIAETVKISVGRKITVRKKVKRKEIHTMLIIRIRNKILRDSFYYLKFDDINSGVYFKNERFLWKNFTFRYPCFWPVAREIREEGYRRIVSLGSFSL